MQNVSSHVSRPLFAASLINGFPKEMANRDELFQAIKSSDVERVASLLREYDVDLSAIDNHNGETPLHMAVTSRQGEIVSLLLEQAESDSNILDAVDRDRYTPLMRAAENYDLPMMTVLVEAGAGSAFKFDTDALVIDVNESRNFNFSLLLSKVMIRGGGDMSKSFEIALNNSAKMLLIGLIKAGVDPVGIMRKMFNENSISNFKKLIKSKAVSIPDVIDLFNDVRRSGDKERFDELLGILVCSPYIDEIVLDCFKKNDLSGVKLFELSDMEAIDLLVKIADITDGSDARKMASMTSFLSAVEFYEPPKVFKLVLRGRFDVVKALHSSGIEINPERLLLPVVNAAMSNNREVMELLLSIGADGQKLLDETDGNLDDWKANLASVMLKLSVLDQPIEQGEKLTKLKEWLKWGSAVEKEAIALFSDAATARDFQLANLFLQANVPSAGVLIDLGRTESRDIARKLVEMGADVRGAMQQLTKSVDDHTLHGRHDEASLDQKAINALVLSLLK